MKDLDAIGRKILRELSSDGRISNLDLAHKVGLSDTQVQPRLAALADDNKSAPVTAKPRHKRGFVIFTRRLLNPVRPLRPACLCPKSAGS